MSTLAILGGSPSCPPFPVIAPAARIALTIDPAELTSLAGSGPVDELETRFRELIGTRSAIAVSSGTAALHCALLACGVEPGNEVICSPYDWPAAAAATLQVGARPIFADIDPFRLTLDPVAVRGALTPQTTAIVVTHILGTPADLPALRAIADEAGIRLVEDCAQALGATIDGRSVGSFGDAACFSFGPGKLIGVGEGGMLVTSDEAIADAALRLSQHPLRQQRAGLEPDYFGLNYRIHPIAARLALDQLDMLPARLAERRARAAVLTRLFSAAPGFTPPFNLQPSTFNLQRSIHRYSPTFLPECWDGLPRSVVLAALQAEGVPIAEGPIHRLVPDRLVDRFGETPVARARVDRLETVMSIKASVAEIRTWIDGARLAIEKVHRGRHQLASLMAGSLVGTTR